LVNVPGQYEQINQAAGFTGLRLKKQLADQMLLIAAQVSISTFTFFKN
jgi:hypothetical protein